MEIGGVPIGIYMVLFIVFAETGLFAGFFLPGDSLLFLSGIYSRELVETFFMIPSDLSNVSILALLIASAATLGNIFGYWFGATSGQFLYNKQDSFFFKKKYLYESQAFFEKHGGKTIIIARFMPFIRTFAPFVAGAGRMSYKHFLAFNVIGGFLWVASFITVGYFFGSHPFVKENFSHLMLGIIVFSLLPAVFEFVRAKLKARKNH